MAETLLDVRREPKPRAYELVHAAFDQVMGDIDDPVTAMATISALLHHGFGFLWTGFYRVASPELLRVGPYQGTLGCLEIPFGKASAAARRRATNDDPLTHQFPGHITCDALEGGDRRAGVRRRGERSRCRHRRERANTFDADDQAGLGIVLVRPHAGRKWRALREWRVTGHEEHDLHSEVEAVDVGPIEHEWSAYSTWSPSTANVPSAPASNVVSPRLRRPDATASAVTTASDPSLTVSQSTILSMMPSLM